MGKLSADFKSDTSKGSCVSRAIAIEMHGNAYGFLGIIDLVGSINSEVMLRGEILCSCDFMNIRTVASKTIIL